MMELAVLLHPMAASRRRPCRRDCRWWVVRRPL